MMLKWILAAACLVAAGPAAAQGPRASAMAAAANAFLATLSQDQRATVMMPFTDDAARTNWSNLPGPLAPRNGLELGGLELGGLSEAQRFFHRIQGPSILTEHAREAAATGGPANHVHAIVRDPRNDYGEDWLDRHYAEDHP